MEGSIHEPSCTCLTCTPSCNRCGNDTSELGCVTIHRDTDLQEKETSYYDLCPRCMTHLDKFLTYQEDAR